MTSVCLFPLRPYVVPREIPITVMWCDEDRNCERQIESITQPVLKKMPALIRFITALLSFPSLTSSSGMRWIHRPGSQSCDHWNQHQSQVVALHQGECVLRRSHVPHGPVSPPPVQLLQADHLCHPRVPAHRISPCLVAWHHRAAAGSEGHESHHSGLELWSYQCELFQSGGKHAQDSRQPDCFHWKDAGTTGTASVTSSEMWCLMCRVKPDQQMLFFFF